MSTPPTESANAVLKQCQHCFKKQTEDRPLLTCSQCKRSHYCDKECQRAHWPQHKDVCRINAQSRANVKAMSQAVRQEAASSGSQESNGGATTMDPRTIESSLKLFSQTRRPILTMAALEAFRLDSHPENIMKYILWVELEFTHQPYPRELRLKNAEIWTLDDFREKYQHPSQASLLQRIDAFHEQSKDIQRRGGLGVAIAIVSCGQVKHMMPLAIADKLSDAEISFSNPESWRETLELGIVSAQY